MATILEFSVHGRAAASEGASGSDNRRRRASAKIIIFPGVRYERHEDRQPVAEHPPPKQRDRLQLVE